LRIFIAGGSGVLGRCVIPLLTAAEHEVTATTRSPAKAPLVSRLGATPLIVDALDRESVLTAVEQTRPDAILHLLTDLSTGDSASNAHVRSVGTRNLVDAARYAGVSRMVAESISWVYPSGITPAVEADPLDPDRAPSRRTTIAAVRDLESAVRELSDGVVLRFGQLYGPGTWYSPEGRYGQDARAGSLPATETVTSFVHTADAAQAALLALEWVGGIWNIVDDDPAAGYDWAPIFADAVGAPEPAFSDTGNVGRPVSNARAHVNGLRLQYPSWRDGFLSL
jgi:nucleoside-diphosphate-sugar epimerase